MAWVFVSIPRVCVKNDLEFGDSTAYSSGGFVANSEVGGEVKYHANQQWFSRAVNTGKYSGGAWSLVMAGCTGKPFEDKNLVCTDLLRRSVEATLRVRMEKPFIAKTKSGDYELHVPNATRDPNETAGPHLDDRNTDVRCFSNVYVAKPKLYMKGDEQQEISAETYNVITEEDRIITMNTQNALDEGKDPVLCPGIFFLTRLLVVKKKTRRTSRRITLYSCTGKHTRCSRCICGIGRVDTDKVGLDVRAQEFGLRHVSHRLWGARQGGPGRSNQPRTDCRSFHPCGREQLEAF
mmetsp:Transcript_9296/g.27727  ORF Transcript_9296/g.27727 Transcript_9296/m.27727 type:complete len:293 (-) Transcript_9296:201-1079(-)